jgi:ABC-type nitrate/sulfonate/bicarbonate transport system permease component
MKQVIHFTQKILFPIVILIIWEIWARIHIASPATIVFPPPTKIINSMIDLLLTSLWWKMAIKTYWVALLGFSLGSVISIVIGVMTGQSKMADRIISPTLLSLRTLPIILFIPISFLIFDISSQIPISLSALVTTLYCTPPVSVAIAKFDLEKKHFLFSRGYGFLKFYIDFVFPEIFSALYQGLSIAITLSLAVTIISEMLIPSLGGLGSLISHSQEMNLYIDTWSHIGLLAISGYFFHGLLMTIWSFAAPWLKAKSNN